MKTIYYPKPVDEKEKTYYSAEPDPNLRLNVSVYDRLMIELAHQQYLSEDELKVLLRQSLGRPPKHINIWSVESKDCSSALILFLTSRFLEAVIRTSHLFSRIKGD